MNFFLTAIPLSIAAHLIDLSPLLVFVLAGVGIVPLADWIRKATEQLALHLGSAIGGLLNVTFGNLAELVLAVFMLMDGKAEVVKAQITGSIIGNALLGLGVAIIVGCIRK